MRFYILTLGCPKNLVDSRGMEEELTKAGHLPVTQPEDADVIIVNTCGFIEEARRESIQALLEMTRIKGKGQCLVAAGCLPQLWGRALLEEVEGIDALLGTRRWMEVTKLIEQLAQNSHKEPLTLLGDPPASLLNNSGLSAAYGSSAYLKIAEGCSAPCAFCTIPRIKGPARSVPRHILISEAKRLVENGIKELILIAQDTTAYGRDWGERDGLANLIEEILEAVPQLHWLRIMYAYPQHVTERLIEVMSTYPQVCHYLDIPLQHAHPEVLRRMNRPHNIARVKSLINDLRRAMPDIAIRTVFIVGYPGETEEEFQYLLDFIEEMAFDRVGAFIYSREEGTKAASLPGQVPEEVKQERYRRLMLLQQRISYERNEEQVGRVLDVLIEGYGEGISVGRSYRDAPEIDGLVIIEEKLPVGEMVPILITDAMEYDLMGVSVK